MTALRAVIGLCLALFALAYGVIGSMFMMGAAPFDTSYGRITAGAGMVGICGPVVLLGLHVAFSGREAPLARRKILMGALTAVFVIGLFGTSVGFLRANLAMDAAQMMFGVVASTLIFGWPILMARAIAGKG